MHSDKWQRLLKDSLWEYNCFVTLSLLTERTNISRELTPWNMSTGIQDLDSAKHIRTLIPFLYYKTIKKLVKCMLYAYHLAGGKSSHLFRCHDSLHYSIDRLYYCYAGTCFLWMMKGFLPTLLQSLHRFCWISYGITESLQGLSLHSSVHNMQGLPKKNLRFFCKHQFLHVSEKYLPKVRCK